MVCSTREKQLACQRRHYQDNKQYYLDRNRKRREMISEWLREYKATLRCSKCGQNHPATLQFHHTDPTQKEYGVATFSARCCSIATIQKEIAKCVVLCANCHAIEHWCG